MNKLSYSPTTIANMTRRAAGIWRVALLLLSCTGHVPAASDPQEPARAQVILVVGAGGDEEFAGTFQKWAEHWQKAAALGQAQSQTIGLDEHAGESLATLQAALEEAAKVERTELWLVLLGHGNPEGKDAKFNLAGDDLAASELAKWLEPIHRPTVLVNAFSASGAFIAPLSASGRVIISATKSGSERNYARFGGYFAESIADPGADLDKDGQTSALEAWLAAAGKVAKFYENEGRLATEHSLLDDNGDQKGTPADWFRGARVVKKAKDGAAPDGLRAHQFHLVPNPSERALPVSVRAERDALELEIAELREKKPTIPEAEYFAALEEKLVRLARLYEAAPGAAR